MDIWSAERAERMSVDFYFDMIGRKTAALIAASVQAGAMLATDDQAVIDAYRGFGWSLGIAFQLNDDLLGIWGDEARTGKEPSDLAKHKKTLPVIYALENADPADAARLREILAADEPSDAEVAEARALIERAGGREYTRGRARAEREEALRRLEGSGIVKGEALARLRVLVSSAISA
jgi:geranylgeranyl diphosphate synthase, type I